MGGETLPEAPRICSARRRLTWSQGDGASRVKT